MMFNELESQALANMSERELLIAAAREAGRRDAEKENSERVDGLGSVVAFAVVVSLAGLIALFYFRILP